MKPYIRGALKGAALAWPAALMVLAAFYGGMFQ